MTTNDDVRAGIVSACDYLDAAMGGLTVYTECVADALGPANVVRGMSALLVFLVVDAANETGTEPRQIIQRMRERYGA